MDCGVYFRRVMEAERLAEQTKMAQKEEADRLRRLQEIRSLHQSNADSKKDVTNVDRADFPTSDSSEVLNHNRGNSNC